MIHVAAGRGWAKAVPADNILATENNTSKQPQLF